MKHDCYECEFFKFYNHATGNVHCDIYKVRQFGFAEPLTCWNFKLKQKQSSQLSKGGEK